MTHVSTEPLRHASETYQPRLCFQPVDGSVLIERGCHFYRRKADEKQISITPDLHVEEPDARADRVAVAVVMDNLLSNAIKYSPHDRVVRVFVRAGPGFLVCSVQDEGPGISEEDQAKLFRRGVRLSSVPTGNEESTGYGLAVAKGLVDAMGGTIWCESRLGHGARFSFRLPKYREEDSPRRTKVPYQTSPPNETTSAARRTCTRPEEDASSYGGPPGSWSTWR